ncbi:MAG: hypothetical protein ACRC7N_19215 [Clostridium sp.]
MGIFKNKQRNKGIDIVSYKSEDIKLYIENVIKIMCSCINKKDIENVYKVIREKISDEDLAIELYSFVPDIYCKVNFPEINYNNEVLFVTAEGKESEMNLSGFIGYTQIEEEMFNRFREGKDKGIYEKIIVHSECFKEINKQLIACEKLSKIKLPPIKYKVHYNYNPFRYIDEKDI